MPMPQSLKATADIYAAQTGFRTVDEILAMRAAKVVSLPVGRARDAIRKPKAHPLYFAGTKDS